jgi:hypothetical protein
MSFDYDVAVYLGSLPKIKNHNLKVNIMRSFANGCTKAGAKVYVGDLQRHMVNARMAVILGWVGMNFSGPHIYFRRDVIEHQKKIGGRTMSIDGSCFKFSQQGDMWLRYSLDSVFYNEGEYANKGADDKKWKHIQQSLGLQCLPWTTNGNHILICLQRDSGWNAKGFDQELWLSKTLKIIRSETQRPILIRPHPSNQIRWQTKVNVADNIQVIDPLKSNLLTNLKGAYAGIFYNSSSSVASVLEGVPVFLSEPGAVTWDVANHTTRNINNPVTPDREKWLNELAACHWTIDHAASGDIYRHFEPYLPT